MCSFSPTRSIRSVPSLCVLLAAAFAGSAAHAASLRARIDVPVSAEARQLAEVVEPEAAVAVRLFFVPEGYEVGDVRVTSDGSSAGRSMGGGILGGHRVHAVALDSPAGDGSARVVGTRSYDVELDLIPSAGPELRRDRPNPRAEEQLFAMLRSQVVNPDDVPEADLALRESGSSQGFAPEELPTVEGSGVDMVIVTTAALQTVFQPLADWKTKKGVPTVIRTVEWIDANYPAGSDQAERIRSFLRDAYQKWGTYLVLLGGDHLVVPTRNAWNTFHAGGEDVATDQYFACLDGDWNGDGDHLWGEGSLPGQPGDSVDLYPDVFVGRAPVATTTEVSTFVSKSLTYDKTPPAGYVEEHGGLAEVLFPSTWSYGDPPGNIQLDGKILLRDSIDVHIPAGWARSLRYQSDNDEDRAIALTELGAGHHILSVLGHGDAFKFSCGNGSNPFVHVADTDALSNGNRLTVFLGVACNPNQIDLECQGESLMNNPSGGAVAVFGSSRVDFPLASVAMQTEMLRAAFGSGITSLGAMNQVGRLRFVPTSLADNTSDRWTWLSKMLLADPELRLWTQEPASLVVNHAVLVSLGTASLTVTVTDTGAAAVAGALVCVRDANGTYARRVTNAAGQAVLPLSSVQTGVGSVVVTAQDFRPYEGVMTITAAAGARLAKDFETIDDNSTGSSSGNGDGVIDAGERIEVGLSIKNGGSSSANASQVQATVETGSNATFDLKYGGVADASKIFVGPDRVHPGAVPFTLSFASPSIDYIGRPTFLLAPDTLSTGGAAADSGIFVWQDREGWHVLWGGGVSSVAVTGKVWTDGRVRKSGSLSLEAGETHTISANGDTLTFGGTTDAQDAEDGVDFTLSDSSVFSVVSGTASLGSVGAGATVVGTVVLDVVDGARDGQVGYVDLALTSSSGGPWSGETVLVCAAPELEAYVFTVSDGTAPPVSGNGNGVIEVGETVRLRPTVINRGTGSAEGVTGTATSPSGITLVDGSDSYGSIASQSEDSGVDGYVFTVNDGTGTTLDLSLTDSVGRVWQKSLDFVAPLSPDSVWFTSTSTRIDVVWTATDSVASPDVAGYNVYRSLTSGTGHVKQNYELLRTGTAYSDEGLSLGSMYFYYVTAVDGSGNESVASAEIQGWTTQAQVPGWPQATGSFNYPGMTMADADHDDTQELYLGSHDFNLHGWGSDAAPLPGFPLTTAFEIWSTAAVADLDHDGNDEILFGGRDSRFYVIQNDGSPFFGSSSWLVDLPGAGEEIRSAATVADVDSDGQLEFLFGSDLGKVYAFNHDGTGLIDSTGLLYSALPADLGSRVWGTIAVADLEGDGPKEIVFASWNNSLYALTPSGAVKPGFPRTELDDFRGGAAIGDLDDDGTLEIIAGNFDGNLYVYNHDGSDYVSGAILASIGFRIGATPSLANVDADPELEIFIGSLNGKLYAYNHDGSSFLPGQGGLFADLPLGAGPNEGISASPVIVDVDGDSSFEIFVGHRNTNFYGFHEDGSTVIGLPIPTGDFIFSTAAAGDLDNDGGVDVAFASYDASVNVLDFAGPSTPAAYEWATYGGNNGRTAAYGDPGPQAVGAPPSNAPQPLELALLPNAPNPFAAATTIRYVMPAARAAKLQVFDISGRLVRTLVDGAAPAGANVVRWDGRDGGGEVLSSGVYFFRLDDGDRTVTRKAVLLR